MNNEISIVDSEVVNNTTEIKKKIKCELYRDNFQNSKRYGIPKAQLVIADIPYNLGNNAYASNPYVVSRRRQQER